MGKNVPMKVKLWRGVIFSGIHGAIRVARSVMEAGSNWDRNHYVLNGYDGREGVITFAGGHWYADAPMVAVFHNLHSERFVDDRRHELPIDRYFEGCPPYQRWLAEQIGLRHLSLDYHGEIFHRVTAAFWDIDGYLVSADSWETVLENGANLIEAELSGDLELILNRTETGISDEEAEFALKIFERKMAKPPALIELSRAELEWLESICEDKDPKEAMRISLDLFAELGILLPKD